MNASARMCLVCHCKCGCGALVAAAVEDPAKPDSNDDFVLEQVKAGFEIRRLGVPETRAALWGCQNPPAQNELPL